MWIPVWAIVFFISWTICGIVLGIKDNRELEEKKEQLEQLERNQKE